MSEIVRRKYEKSPVIEVLCDIQFERNEDNFKKSDDFYKLISAKFPEIKKGKKVSILEHQIEDQQGVIPEVVQMEALRFANIEATQIIQISDDNLVFNDVQRPYKGYENFQNDFIEVISAYIEAVSPQKAERLELRYINEFRFETSDKSDLTGIHKYFNFTPRFDDSISSFQFQFQVQTSKAGHYVFVTLMTLPLKPDSKERVCIADIQNIYLKTNVVDIRNIEAALRDAHENIGRVFEKLITPETRVILKEVENDSCNWQKL